ncbi:MAG TPA: decarboxylating 6-phosphogluconate dehydrogenase [Anaerolineaceae bacterium]
MKIGLVGLGKMGLNIAVRLIRGGHQVTAADVNPDAVNNARSQGIVAFAGMEAMIADLPAPRAVWVMVPAGKPTEGVLERLGALLSPGDILIDGGNSYYKDSIRRSEQARLKGLHYLDVGTSGGIWGLEEGYSMMIGGEEEIVEYLRPIFETLAPERQVGWGRVGPNGAGHFVKMVHNGIEYGIMQAFAEGFDLMGNKVEFNLDLGQISQIWQHGSVVRSWLLDLIADILRDNPDLVGIAPYVPDSGEGRWTVMEAVELAVPIPVITMALERRFASRMESPFSDKLLSALRNRFGGHEVRRVE